MPNDLSNLNKVPIFNYETTASAVSVLINDVEVYNDSPLDGGDFTTLAPYPYIQGINADSILIHYICYM